MLVLTVAVAPALALALYFYHKDAYEKEPLKLLVKVFFLGAGAVFLAGTVETPLAEWCSSFKVVWLSQFLYSFVAAACVEEGIKFLVFMLFIYRHREFDEPYDGILYAVMISLGFAALENIAFVAIANAKSGISGIAQVGFARALFSVPGHALNAVIMGYFLGQAKFCGDKRAERKFLFKALGFAVVAHGLYNFFIFTRNPFGILFMIYLFFTGWRYAFKAMKVQVDKSVHKG